MEIKRTKIYFRSCISRCHTKISSKSNSLLTYLTLLSLSYLKQKNVKGWALTKLLGMWWQW